MGYRQDPLAKVLSRQIVEAAVQIGLAQDDLLGGEILHTDLPWQLPPLVLEAPLYGVPFNVYIDQHTYVNQEALVSLWADTLANLKNAPYKVLNQDGSFRTISSVIPHLKGSERLLYLSQPEGFPGSITDLAAVTLSLECAHLLKTNGKIDEFVSDDSNYFARLPDGTEVGIKEGVPAVFGDIWDMPVEGVVQELLATPRGAVWEGCDYDVISKVRSVMFHYQRSIRDFTAIDWALQTLRVIEGQKYLLKAVQSIKQVKSYRQAKANALKEALDVINRMGMTDRQKVETLKGLLVPQVISASEFTKKLISYHAPVAPLLADKVLTRMRNSINELYEKEMMLYGPSDLQR